MSSTISLENLKKAFTFPFKDKEWMKKIGIGSLYYFLGILIIPRLFASGYSYEIMRRIIVDGEEPSLPEWDDLESYLQGGIKVYGVHFFYGTPAIMFLIPYFMLLLFLLPLMSISEEYKAAMMAILPLTLGLIIFASLTGFLFGIFGLVAKAHMIAKGEFFAAFRPHQWFPIFRQNKGGFILGYLIIITAGFLIGLAINLLALTIILCLIVPILLFGLHFYTVVVSSAIFAQAYVDGLEKLPAEKLPAEELAAEEEPAA